MTTPTTWKAQALKPCTSCGKPTYFRADWHSVPTPYHPMCFLPVRWSETYTPEFAKQQAAQDQAEDFVE